LRKQSIQSLIWTAVYIILLLSIITPFLPITICLLMIPVMALAVRETPLRLALHVIPAIAIAYLLAGSLSPVVLIIGLFFLPAGIVMGSLHQKHKSARIAITGGAVTLLAEMLLIMVITSLSGFDLTAAIREMSQTYLDTIEPLIQGVIPPEAETAFIDMMIAMIPTLMIMLAVFWAFVTHGLGRVLLSATGTEISRLKPLREWMLPKSFVWIFLIVLLFNMFADPTSKSVIVTMAMNLYPLILFAFAVQALSFFFYITYVNKKSRALPIISILALIFLPPAVFIYSFIGLFDVTFGLRERFRKNK
jgi:uncharacterized protein YybS (DUF2232 family)